MLAAVCRQRQGGYNVDWFEGDLCGLAFDCTEHRTAIHSCTYALDNCACD